MQKYMTMTVTSRHYEDAAPSYDFQYSVATIIFLNHMATWAEIGHHGNSKYFKLNGTLCQSFLCESEVKLEWISCKLRWIH